MSFQSKHFKLDEFQCKCGLCPLKEPNPSLVNALDALRDHLNQPVILNSAIRCRVQNDLVAGEKDSAHLDGDAADIAVTDSSTRYKMLRFIPFLVRRYGIGKTFIHIDVSKRLDQDVVWGYYR